MIKTVESRLWAFDMEWIPDPVAGRRLYDLAEDVSDADAMAVMWERGGASEEDPQPFLKLIQCRVVSVAAVERNEEKRGRPELHLLSLPHDPHSADESSEAQVVGTFLEAIGKHRPQLVGFNSIQSDLKILVQRGIALGLRAAGFCERPDKPWLGVDYFARGSNHNVDLRDAVGGFGRATTPSLHELAVLSGIPGKLDVDGNQVAQMWLDGRLEDIVRYNEFDALTTYLVWLRVAHFAGKFSAAEYQAEQRLVRDLIEGHVQDGSKPHLATYLEAWEKLSPGV